VEGTGTPWGFPSRSSPSLGQREQAIQVRRGAQAQKEAAKHRKRMEAMGIEQVEESQGQENILKTIVI
jgi:hypothetical protein